MRVCVLYMCVCVCAVKHWSDGSLGYFRSCSRFSKVQAITFSDRVPFAKQSLAVCVGMRACVRVCVLAYMGICVCLLHKCVRVPV